MALVRDPARHYMRLADWPEPDRLAWAAATAPGDILDGQGRFAGLAARTLENYRSAYGRWLTFHARRGTLNSVTNPASRATPAAMLEFVDQLRLQVAPLTLAQRIIDLEQVLRASGPEQDWSWLRRLATRLTRVARPVRDKRAAIRPTDELCAIGIRLMARAEASIGARLNWRAEMYRDGLMLALLAMRPFRLTNFTSIRIGHHLRQLGSGWTIMFEEQETKTRAHLELPFPEALVAALERYLSLWRRVLLGRAKSDRLWISGRSTPFGIHGVRSRIGRTTETYLGVRIWPHLLRDCLATHVAIEDPEHVRIATVLLGHRRTGTTERHYNLAGQRQGAQRWQAALLARRRTAERR